MEYKYNFNKKKNNNSKIYFSIIMLFIILIISSFFFKNSNNLLVKKFFSVVNKPFVFVENILYTHNLKDENVIIKENNELKEKINNLEIKLNEIKRLEIENKSLKNLLDIKETFKQFNLKYAKIINRNFDDFGQIFIINVGEKDGIKKEQNVISKDGIVGYISSVNSNTSVVTTILSPKTNISVVIAALNQNAVVKGDLSLKTKNKLKLDYIPLNSEISIGDSIYTSGIGSIFKPSILVGKIIDVINNKNDTDRYAIIEPSVNINSLTEVAVILE